MHSPLNFLNHISGQRAVGCGSDVFRQMFKTGSARNHAVMRCIRQRAAKNKLRSAASRRHQLVKLRSLPDVVQSRPLNLGIRSALRYPTTHDHTTPLRDGLGNTVRMLGLQTGPRHLHRIKDPQLQ
mgnify:CR=1 FL=1